MVIWFGICNLVSLRPSDGFGVDGVLPPRLGRVCLKVMRGAVGGGMPWSSRLRFDPADGFKDVR